MKNLSKHSSLSFYTYCECIENRIGNDISVRRILVFALTGRLPTTYASKNLSVCENECANVKNIIMYITYL